MARWQFSVGLVPQVWLDSGGRVESLFGDEGHVLSEAWEGVQPVGLRERLNALLPSQKSWSESLSCWGDEQGDDIHLMEDDGNIVDLSVRFDLRRPNMDFFASIVEIAIDLDFGMLDLERQCVIERTSRSLRRAAAHSETARFVADPKAYIEDLAQRGPKTS